MKVICITHQNFASYPFDNIPRPDIGDEVTVIRETYFHEVPTYILEEYSPFYHYDRRWFAIKSDVDETQLSRENEMTKQEVYEPTTL